MSPEVALIIGAIAGVAAIILLYVKVLPKNADGNLNNSFLQFLHNYFHFKKLYIEAVLKFFFTLLTVFSMTIGFFMLFARVEGYWSSYSMFWYGVALLVVVPIVLRITYELSLMVILLVQNVIDINRKMGGAPKKEVKPVVNNTPVNNVPVNNVPPVNNAYPVNNGYPVNNAYQANNNVPPVNNNFAAGNDMYAAPQEQPQQFQQPQNPQW